MTPQPDTDEVLSAPLVIEYPFTRTTGPVLGAFLTGLREQVLVGIKATDSRVICPPVEYDPTTGEDLTEMVEVGPVGTVVNWAFVAEPHEKHPLDHPFAWAQITLDGADTPLLHVVDVARPDLMSTGLRVVPSWVDEREGHINDIACIVPEESA